MSVLGVVFARGGSKGIPRKNLALVGDKPLLVHSIDAAKAARTVSRVIVSTDDEEIANVARAAGAEVPFMRPQELAGDKAAEILAWQHAIRTMRELSPDFDFDVMVSVPATSPLRSSDDVDAVVDAIRTSDADLVISVTQAARSPYFNMVKLDENGFATIVNEARFVRRQDAPAVYDITTVAYAVRPDYVLKTDHLMSGRVKAVVVPAERALDIDTPFDLHVARLLWDNPWR